MKHSLFFLVLSLTASLHGFFVVAVRAQVASPVAQELLQIETARVSALVHNDLPALDKLLAPDLTYVHSSGALENKSEFMDKLRTGERKYVSMQHDDGVAVRSYSDTAILTGSTKVQVVFKGQTQNLHLRFTETWFKHGKEWQVVAWHATKLPE